RAVPIVSFLALVLGIIVGLVTLRDQMVQEFGDLAVGLDKLDQSWEVQYFWEDAPHGWSDTSTLEDPEDAEPANISVQQAPINESEPLEIPECP
ncbi:MAG: hypothetical protein ACOCWL_03845, partial [Thermoguttaceae bacterium]